MTMTAHDFTRPLPLAPATRAILAQWLGRVNALLAEGLTRLSVTVELRFEDSATAFPLESLAEWSDKSLAFQLGLEGAQTGSVLAIPNPLVQDLVSRVLGDSLEKTPAERELTAAELSIAEFLCDTIIKSLKESWLGETAVELSLGTQEANLRRSKLFRPTEPIVVCRSIVRTSLGESCWCWLMTNDFMARLIGLPERIQTPAAGISSQQNLERLIRQMSTEVEVRLGGVQLTGPQLARLRVGDVVVLDQRLSDPLRAFVSGEPKFLGWPGRVGNRQAFEIESEVRRSFPADKPDVA